MTEHTSNPSVGGSFESRVAASLETRARELSLVWLEAVQRSATTRPSDPAPVVEGTPPDHVPELIRAFAGALAGDATSVSARVERELTRLVRLRRAQGHALSDVLSELGTLQDVMLEAVLAEAAGRDGVPAAAGVFGVVARFHRAARRMMDATLRIFEQDLLARRQQRASLLGGFARAVTHELRNRANAARLCLSVYRSASEQRQEELLETLDQSLKQLEDAIGDVSSVTLVQARELPAEGRLQPLRELLAYLRRDFDELALASRIEVRVAQPIPDLAVDAGKVQLALLNLVTNALKHADGSKRDRWVEIRVVPGTARDEWRVDVEDNGAGLPPLEQAVGDSEGKPEPQDRPAPSWREIGIAMAHEAVLQLGGRLWVASNAEGVGTTVSFTLRAAAIDRGSRAERGA
jgi:signal transduction histidine kinase